MDCSGRDQCIHFANDPTGPGVCADPLWALDNPPCVPFCSDRQFCVQWGDRPNSCADPCMQGSDCSSGCCTALQDGTKVCAPASSYCAAGCNPSCSSAQVCLALSPPVCANTCSTDADCPGSCCLMLQGGGGACAPGGAFCPTMPPPPCTTISDCVQTNTQFTPAPMASCGTAGSYEGALANYCSQAVVCRACWWSTQTSSYSDCVVLGQIPTNATVPVGTTRCASAMFPDPAVRVRCIDVASYRSGNDCLGSGPLSM
jgi:hypothetical protein